MKIEGYRETYNRCLKGQVSLEGKYDVSVRVRAAGNALSIIGTYGELSETLPEGVSDEIVRRYELLAVKEAALGMDKQIGLGVERRRKLNNK